MTQALKAFAALPSMHFDVNILLGNLRGNRASVTEQAERAIKRLRPLSLKYGVELYMVHWSHVTDSIRDPITLESWYEMVREKLGLEPCPALVVPMLALGHQLDKNWVYTLAMEPVISPEGEVLGNFSLQYCVGGAPILSANEKIDAFDSQQHYWIFCKHR